MVMSELEILWLRYNFIIYLISYLLTYYCLADLQDAQTWPAFTTESLEKWKT